MLSCAASPSLIHHELLRTTPGEWERQSVSSPDFLVLGGGIIGVSVARELKHRFQNAQVTLVEKEAACGRHASGRNSGIIHAGFYYSADSLKAKLTRAGNQAMTDYCEAKKIPLNRCGKLVVAQNQDDLSQLDELLRRGEANGVPLENLTEEEAREIEPRVKTYQRAIFSPTTASADPRRVIEEMTQDAKKEGITIRTGAPYLRARKGDGYDAARKLQRRSCCQRGWALCR